jgi:hypothetical protein
MDGAKFTGKLNMDSVQVGGHLFMRSGAEFGEVVLTAAKIQGNVEMSGAKFAGKLDMDSVQVENNLFMRSGAEFGEVILVGAKIGGYLSMDGAKFTGKLDMDSVQVGGPLFMRHIEVNTSVPLRLIFAEIGGHVELLGEAMPSIDLTGARIRGEFRLGSRTSPTTWQNDAKVILQNAEVGALQDIPEVWPFYLELSGLRYAHLGAYTLDEPNGHTKDIATDSISSDPKWLAKQATYSPQPYEQLAGILQKMGHKDEAEDILYAGKDRELSQSSGFDWVGLFLLKIFIGYGYRIYYAIGWVLGFIALGALVLKLSKQGAKHNMPYGIAYSFDMLLPLIKLREHHYNIEPTGWPRYYFYVHKIMGYVLASFLIAGLSGLAK